MVQAKEEKVFSSEDLEPVPADSVQDMEDVQSLVTEAQDKEPVEAEVELVEMAA